MTGDAVFLWPRWAAARPDAIALIYEAPPGQTVADDGLGTLSWGQLAVAVERVAVELQQAGFIAGETLVHASGNGCRGVLLALASMALGTIEVPIDPLTDPAARQVMTDIVDGRTLEDALAACDGVLHRVANLSPADIDAARRALLERHARRKAREASLILFTSGTGGSPKAVTLSRHNLASNAAAKLAAVPTGCDDVRLCLLPISHAYARTCDLGTWLASGGTLAITSGWNGWKRVAPHVRPTAANMVPSVATRLLEEPPSAPELSRLKLLGCGGAALAADTFAALASRGITVIQGYGLTEASPVICSATPQNARPGWVGRPVQGWATRVESDGRLWVCGDGVMLGYWNDPQATGARIVDGWLDTGDLVEVDRGDGQYRILGRVDDRITLPNARKVYPARIEQRLAALPGVLHALLVPSGRHLELWIDVQPELRADSDWSGRVDALLADLPAWERPRRVRVLAEGLSQIAGALTRKGTPRRGRVIEYFGTCHPPSGGSKPRDEASGRASVG